VLVGGAFWLLLPHAERREAAPISATASSETSVAVRPLGLYVDTSGATWRISWNRDATALHGARAVALFVRDGDDQNRVDLSPQDLQSGSYQYKPGGQDVTFRLEVTDNGGHLTAESFRLMKSAPAVPAERPKPAAPATNPATNILRPVPRIKVPPTVPASIRPRIKEPIPIDVWVQVDTHGRVTDAVPATKQHAGLDAYLATRAVSAARQWRFDPAREDGKAVPGRERIHFLFER
jgi:protein TonB